mmetsp:Transcript_36258/g.66984  ORF Transcript_36258/g.66984 Transcript_36258/m.66984 type:complete len:141 (+) Transcript_36258:134-556(+)
MRWGAHGGGRLHSSERANAASQMLTTGGSSAVPRAYKRNRCGASHHSVLGESLTRILIPIPIAKSNSKDESLVFDFHLFLKLTTWADILNDLLFGSLCTVTFSKNHDNNEPQHKGDEGGEVCPKYCEATLNVSRKKSGHK